ncbi:hypothetical protein CAEBREN_01706 [Caenorhabditis brenneri]|uniref:Uncharacterized protein n=1 Tax=Caenorhabditis brenneri TaxID=135651 RepID=G0NQC4_CAEBE|nr:hypothetical protein CAEBREN_01706 [Caenorhabditis brenneri]
MPSSSIILHEVKPSPVTPNHTDFDHRMGKLMEILKDHNGERTVILGNCDQSTRHVLMKLHCSSPKTRLQPVGFMKYVLDDNDYRLIRELKESFEKDQKRKIGVCSEQIFEKVDFGKIDKVIIFDFPTRFKELHELLKTSVSKIHVITTSSDSKVNIEAVKKLMEKEGGAKGAPTVAKNIYPYPKEDDFWDWNSDEEEEEEEFDERDYDYSHLEG